ncbi:MAG: class I SAM-dependent methyltransferase family protein [Methanomassiliicoccaceae archaeon]|jgi:tRNA (guanine37-N1)-methyltransferase|nr:class I SAM-dependent methyltransferase family protein [Methanomassiliicoccaceae archaeon]
MALCIRVPKEKGEEVRDTLISSGLLDRGFKIRSDGDSILIPVISSGFGGYDTIDADLELAERRETDYRNLADIPDVLREMLPTSYDVIGDIAVIKLSDDLLPYASAVGNALLKASSSLRAAMTDGGVKGDMRLREVTMIAGTGTSETRHKEFGVTMIVDPAKAYFNPRLSTERMRIASLVRGGEIIIDMFAGVAPFPLVIAKHSEPSAIYAIDVNKDAVGMMERNIRLNKLTGIIPICGDAGILISDLPPADRIIMNLPQAADLFLHAALTNIRSGGTIHLHKIMERSTSSEMISKLIEDMNGKGHRIRADRIAELKTYSPTMSVYVIDIVRS